LLLKMQFILLFSETRFVEVMEHICGSDDKEGRFKVELIYC